MKILLAIAAVIVIALCAGGGYTAYKLVSKKKDTPAASPTVQPTANNSGAASPTSKSSASGSTSGGNAANPDTFVKGDCFVNDAAAKDPPKLRKTACTSAGAYEVIVKIPGTTDDKKCNAAPPAGAGDGNWSASYKMDKNPGTANDYVLCLKQHT
jgi:hypothetical protein